MKILVARHGLTEYNKLKRLNSQTIDDSLVDEGKEAATRLANSLENKIDIIFTSDLKRTKQTADIINKHLKVDVFLEPRLREIHFGSLAGKTWDEIVSELGQEFLDKYLVCDYDIRPFGGESSQDVKERILDFIEEVKKFHEDKNVLLVTHGGIIRFLQYHFKKDTHNKISNVSIHEFEV